MKRIVIVLLAAALLFTALPLAVFCAPTGIGEYVITTSKLNVRSGPDSSYKAIGSVLQGEVVNVTLISNVKWGRIDYKGQEGWISLNYAFRTAAKQFSVNEEGIKMLKKLEGYARFAYWDYQQWSIGYGSHCEENEYPDGISEEKATELLVNELKISEGYVDEFLDSNSITVTQPQYNALVSFTYNLGNLWGRSEDFALRDILRNGIIGYSEQQIKDAFGEFVSAGGQVVNGLIQRRATEAQMFLSGTTFKVGGFEDVSGTAWYADEVAYCLEKSYMKGMSDTEFSPNTNVTREQFVLILANIAGVNTDIYKDVNSNMTDVPTGRWYSGAVTWAVQAGYVKGVSEGVFGCGQPIQRAALVRLLYLYAENNGLDVSGRADLGRFADFEEICHPNNAWMTTALEWAVFKGIISGVSVDGATSIMPKSTATRAQTARMLMQFDRLIIK